MNPIFVWEKQRHKDGFRPAIYFVPPVDHQKPYIKAKHELTEPDEIAFANDGMLDVLAVLYPSPSSPPTDPPPAAPAAAVAPLPPKPSSGGGDAVAKVELSVNQ